MKTNLLLSLLLVIPIHAMDKGERYTLLPHAYHRETQSLPVDANIEKSSTNPKKSHTKKWIATALITLLASAGSCASYLNTMEARDVSSFKVLPFAHNASASNFTLPFTDSTCTYEEKHTQLVDTPYCSQCIWHHAGKECTVDDTRINPDYCACENNSCPVVVEKCPFNRKKNFFMGTGITSWAAQIGTYITGMIGIWKTN